MRIVRYIQPDKKEKGILLTTFISHIIASVPNVHDHHFCRATRNVNEVMNSHRLGIGKWMDGCVDRANNSQNITLYGFLPDYLEINSNKSHYNKHIQN